jgi:WD40 repeat protein/serine/threonine protein kinase
MKASPADVKSVFGRALEIESSVARAAYLDEACGADAALRAEVEGLLATLGRAGDFMGRPAAAVAAQVTTNYEPVTEGPGTVIGPYKLMEQIGEGGMGLVFVAEQQEPVRRRVALKIIKPGMDSRHVIARFEAERQALALMDHQNIAKVLDAGTTESGRPYFVMELVHGVPITQYCDANQLTPRQRLELFVPVCLAIQHAHQKGIIHRDIKPSNVLVTMYDDKPVPKVIDFGVAKATEQRLTEKTVYTQFGTLVGTFEYMSPEQAEMNAFGVDTRSDIYSLGVLLYELLTGTTPLERKRLREAALGEMVRLIKEEEAPRPSLRLSSSNNLPKIAAARNTDPARLSRLVRGEIDWIVMRCLEKDRGRRYESANGLARDIQRYLADEPVEACPPNPLYRFQKMVRRNKAAAVAAAGILAALVIGLGISTWMYLQERKAYEQTAQAEREQARLRSVEEDLRKNETNLRERAQTGEREAKRAAAALKRTAYVGDMALVQQAIAEGNLARARSLLDRYRPKAGEDDIRGFEWRYLWAQARSDEAAKLGEYSAFLSGLAISPDGKYLASKAPKAIEIRSLHDRALIATLRNGGEDPIQFSPDGKFLATVRDGGLVLWNTSTWKEGPRLAGATVPFVFAQQGQIIVARQGDRLSIWNVETATKTADFPGTVSFHKHLKAIAVSPDGNTVFLGATDQIRSWELKTRSELEPISYPLGTIATSLAVSPEGLLAAAHINGQVRLWDLKSRQLLHTFESHLSWVSSVVFSPDGSFLASASFDQSISLYETKSRKLLRRFRGHEGEIWALQYSPDGHWLVSGSNYDQTVRLWDLTDKSKGRDQVEMTLPLRFVDSSRSLICGSRKQGFARMDVKTGTLQPLPAWSFPSKEHDFSCVYVSPDGNSAVTVVRDRDGLHIVNLPSKERGLVLSNTSWDLPTAAFSEDGKRLAAAEKDMQIRLWNTTDWSSEVLGDPTSDEVYSMAFSPNGSHLAQIGHNGGMVFDLASRKTILRFKERRALSLAFSPDGRYLAAGDEFNLIHLWDVNNRQKLGSLRGHVSGVAGLSFSPDGKTLASSGDKRVKLWNIETMQEILTIARFSNLAFPAMFSPDGSCLATSSWGDEFQLFRAPSFEEIAAVEAKERAVSKKP